MGREERVEGWGMGWRDGMKTSSEDDNKRGREKRMTTATSSGSLDRALIGTSYLREKNCIYHWVYRVESDPCGQIIQVC
jgi:hypothetical protein